MHNYLWLVLALVSAFSLATSDALLKKALKRHNEYIIGWLRLVTAMPFLLGALYFTQPPKIAPNFYYAFGWAIPIEMAALVLYVKALKVSPMSLTLPFLALSPVFLIFTSYILLGEKVSTIGITGIIMIAAGSYVLNLSEFKNGILEPILAIKKERGSIYIIITAFLYSISASFGKMGVDNSSSIFFGATFFIGLGICMTPLALIRGKAEIAEIFKNGAVKNSILPGFFYALMIMGHMLSVSMVNVAYTISVKRLSLLIGVLYGWLFFKETGIRERLAGTFLMLAGVIIIAIF
ncbi:MAG: EamA family transporter [Candidatus Wallbacteria bacterium]